MPYLRGCGKRPFKVKTDRNKAHGAAEHKTYRDVDLSAVCIRSYYTIFTAVKQINSIEDA